MIKNYLKTTISIASSLFVALHISDELSYDRYHNKGGHIYRAILQAKLGDQIINTVSTTVKLAGALRKESASVETATNVEFWGSTSFLYEDKNFIEQNSLVVDSAFFNVFSFSMLYGNAAKALNEPNSVVLTEDLAIKYFGDASEALDKLMVVDGDSISFKVTGVVENVPSNSHFKFTALLSRQSFPKIFKDGWTSTNVHTYFVLNENSTVDQADAQLENLIQKYVSPELKQYLGVTVNEFRETGAGQYNMLSQSLYDIHLYSSLSDELEPQGDINYIYILLAIGLFLLLIASINFMNLSTAKSANRAKEVGLRKTMGATRGQLIGQFLTESMVFSIVSALLALLLVYLFLPSYNLLSGKMLMVENVFQPMMLLVLIMTVIIVGLLAGSYPAFYLTSFEIIDVIKGKLNAGSKNKSVRGILVTFQFWVSIVLIISTAIVYKQLEFAQNKKIGINKEHVLYIKSTFRLGNDREAYKNSLSSQPEIEALSYLTVRFPNGNYNSSYQSKNDDKNHLLSYYSTDYDHQKVMGFEMLEGRFFSPEFGTDSTAIIINEAAVKEMGWDNPLDEILLTFNDEDKIQLKVIGVVKDFNFESLKEEIKPLVMRYTKTAGTLAIRFNGADYQQVIDKAEQEWDKLVPDEPFEYSFMAEDFDQMFRAEQRLMKLFTLLTGLAIFIAALGLFGLTAFTAEQRTKEIGIRKALGASVWDINTLLTKEFNKLVFIAFVLAIYPVYYLMTGWLDNFAYRISLGIWVFVMGGLVSLVISWLTVSFQAQKVARANPMDALKYE